MIVALGRSTGQQMEDAMGQGSSSGSSSHPPDATAKGVAEVGAATPLPHKDNSRGSQAISATMHSRRNPGPDMAP